ncbi:MAG: Ig-like domain-containing protein, partial [Candidatus Binatia bacterium]
MIKLLVFAFPLLLGMHLEPSSLAAQTATRIYVSRNDPTCSGLSPCFRTIQAAINAAGPGTAIQIQAGIYPERLTITGKNNFSSANESSRIVIEAAPELSSGSVVILPPAASCLNGQGVLIRQSKFITLRSLTITGATGPGVALLGGLQQNQAIHIERSRIVDNGSAKCPAAGVSIALGNPDTLIVNTLIYDNAGNGITFADLGGGPHWLIQNTIHGNGWNGVGIVLGHAILLANNLITTNGQASGAVGGRHGVHRVGLPWQEPEAVRLINNLICGNRLGEVQGPLFDPMDTGNLTPAGNEGDGVSASPGCNLPATVYANTHGPDNLPSTIDDDFSLASHSPAIEGGMDPRVLGLNLLFDTLFTADFDSDFSRPADGDGDRLAAFDIGAFETANRPPVANAEPDQTVYPGVLVTVNGNQSHDPEGASLDYRWSLLAQPPGSSIVLSNPASSTQQFTPLLLGNYVLQLVVNDGQVDSGPDTVQISAINRVPIASDGVATTTEDTPVTLVLTARDPDGNSLSFSLMTAPSNGALGIISAPQCVADGSGSNCSATVVYAPAANYSGPDSLTFRVNDGTADSNVATVSIVVDPANDAPVANHAAATTTEDTPVTIVLTARDPDGNSLSFSLIASPSNGALGGISVPNCVPDGGALSCTATVIYTPAPNYSGPDSFTFRVSDGGMDSNIATVSVSVNPVNDPPVAHGATALAYEDSTVAISLSASDVDNNSLSFAIVTGPSRGTLGSLSPPDCIASGSGSTCTVLVTYTPAANSHGTDSFTFKANDSLLDSAYETISITVDAINDAALVANDVYSTFKDKPLVLAAPGILG